MELIFEEKISLLAFDLDGTLVNDAGVISDFTLETLQALMERGVKVTTASGRHYLTQQEPITRLGLKGPYIASNGAIICNSVDDSILYSKTIDPEAIRRFCAFASNEGLHFCFQTLDSLYFTRDNPRAARFMNAGLNQQSVYFLPKNYTEFPEPIFKVVIHVTTSEQTEKLAQYLEREPDVVPTLSNKNIFEINPKGTSKGDGIAWVADYYGIPLEEVCAFGDYDNDISALEKVGLPIAMGNATDNLKAKARYITDTNNNDGVAKALIDLENCFR